MRCFISQKSRHFLLPIKAWMHSLAIHMNNNIRLKTNFILRTKYVDAMLWRYSDINVIHGKTKFIAQLNILLTMTLNEAWEMPKTTKELLQSWHMKVLGKEKLKTWNSLPSVICWIIWKERSTRIFESRKESVISFLTVFIFFSWCNMAIQMTQGP